MEYELGVPALLTMLAKLLHQSASTIANQPGNRSPEQVASSLENLKGIASRAEFLACQIAGKES